MLNRAGLSALPIENVYHLGFAVPDLDAAMRELAEQFGATWAEPRLGAIFQTARPGEPARPWTIDAVYSRQGPPFFELVRGPADPACIWDSTPGPRLHHVGLFASDVHAEAARFERLGYRLDALAGPAEDAPETLAAGPRAVAFLTSPFGFYLEIVPELRRAALEEWVRGSALEGP